MTRPGRDPAGASTPSPARRDPGTRRAPGAGRAGHPALLGPDVAGRPWRPGTSWPATGVAADAFSVTSYTELRDDALSAERWNRLHPTGVGPHPLRDRDPGRAPGPVVAVSDYVRAVPDQVARWVPRPFTSLGTDGFGRSDTRASLRRFFEVDAAHLVVAVLAALAREGEAKSDEVAEAIAAYGIDPEAADPWAV